MGFFKSINISASGMTAERLRMDVISRNIANANTTRTASGTPYRRQLAVVRQIDGNTFEDFLTKAQGGQSHGRGVEVSQIIEDQSEFKLVYNPGHPDANDEGYVKMPNVETVTEMIDMISATRAYEANVTSINSAKAMAMKALEIGR